MSFKYKKGQILRQIYLKNYCLCVVIEIIWDHQFPYFCYLFDASLDDKFRYLQENELKDISYA